MIVLPYHFFRYLSSIIKLNKRNALLIFNVRQFAVGEVIQWASLQPHYTRDWGLGVALGFFIGTLLTTKNNPIPNVPYKLMCMVILMARMFTVAVRRVFGGTA